MSSLGCVVVAFRHCVREGNDIITELEALRERRPPWPRQIITLILYTVKNVEPWL